MEDALFPQGASPPPHLNNMHTPPGNSFFEPMLELARTTKSNLDSLLNPLAHPSAVNQLLRRAAAAAAIRREQRNSSSHSDDLQQLKRHRSDSGIMGNNNNNNLDIINHHQITPTDFSTNIKLNNNLSPHIKDSDRLDVKTPTGKAFGF